MTYEEAIKMLENSACSIVMEEAVDVAIEALAKQIPKKIVKGKDLFWEYQCPNANCDTQFTRHASYEFCPGCGQAIDWSEYK